MKISFGVYILCQQRALSINANTYLYTKIAVLPHNISVEKYLYYAVNICILYNKVFINS